MSNISLGVNDVREFCWIYLLFDGFMERYFEKGNDLSWIHNPVGGTHIISLIMFEFLFITIVTTVYNFIYLCM